MWHDQLSRTQQIELGTLACGMAMLAFYAPLALVFNLPIWPMFVLEILLASVHLHVNKQRPGFSDIPWTGIYLGLSSFGVEIPAIFVMLTLARPKMISRLWDQHTWLSQKLQLIAVSGILLTVTHIISCGWLMIQPPTMSNPLDKYIWGIYWTVTTLATVGYGDITPQTSGARFYAMAIMMVGVSSFAIFVSHFSRLLINRDSKLEAQKAKMKHLGNMMFRYQVPLKTRHEIFQLYQHILTHKSDEEEENVLAELPVGIRDHLKVHMKVKAISGLEIFKDQSKECLELIARNFEDRFYEVGEVIIKQGEIGHEMFVLHHGEVEIFKNHKKVGHLSDGKVFGEIALIEAAPRNAEVVAKRHSHILILNAQAYEKIITKHPEFQNKLESIYRMRKVA